MKLEGASQHHLPTREGGGKVNSGRGAGDSLGGPGPGKAGHGRWSRSSPGKEEDHRTAMKLTMTFVFVTQAALPSG